MKSQNLGIRRNFKYDFLFILQKRKLEFRYVERVSKVPQLIEPGYSNYQFIFQYNLYLSFLDHKNNRFCSPDMISFIFSQLSYLSM